MPVLLDGMRDNVALCGEERTERTDYAAEETEAERRNGRRVALKMRYTVYA